MGIAQTILLKPSRILKVALFAIAALVNFSVSYVVAVRLGSGKTGLLVVLAVLCASLILIKKCIAAQSSWRIDIGDDGQLILRGKPPLRGEAVHALVSLGERSTLWPQLLVLHLHAADGARYIIPVLPDSTDDAGFRGLLVALRWIALKKQSE